MKVNITQGDGSLCDAAPVLSFFITQGDGSLCDAAVSFFFMVLKIQDTLNMFECSINGDICMTW
ncbi:MAG: hypothetical protein Kow00103_02540 [Candidatus Caldatribacteriota bacterium]